LDGEHERATTGDDVTRRSDASGVVIERPAGDVPEDPFFAVRGYEELGDACVLTGVGIQLLSALQRLATESIRESFPTSDSFELPASMKLTCVEYHDMWGCRGTEQCAACKASSETLLAPSWMTLLQKGFDSRYWDRQLPVVRLLLTSAGDHRDFLDDGRETTRRASWRKNGRKGRPWHERLARQPLIQVLALAGPSLEVDSRPLQNELLQHAGKFYRHLVPDRHIGVRAIPATELLPAEASRLVLEGSLPGCDEPVCLGYLSNLLDYASTGIRHGTTREGLHALQGCLCSLPETLEWMLRNRAGERAVPVPRALRRRESLLPAEMRYQRKRMVGKGGKTFVEPMVDPNRERFRGNGRAVGEGPTPERIRGEALSSPFNFLPFYHR
jgi:hypothetical protein